MFRCAQQNRPDTNATAVMGTLLKWCTACAGALHTLAQRLEFTHGEQSAPSRLSFAKPPAPPIGLQRAAAGTGQDAWHAATQLHSVAVAAPGRMLLNTAAGGVTASDTGTEAPSKFASRRRLFLPDNQVQR